MTLQQVSYGGHGEYMDRRALFRNSAFIVWGFTCFGAVAVDLDHFVSIVFKNPALWRVLHEPVVSLLIIGLAFASVFGLCSTLFLGKDN